MQDKSGQKSDAVEMQENANYDRSELDRRFSEGRAYRGFSPYFQGSDGDSYPAGATGYRRPTEQEQPTQGVTTERATALVPLSEQLRRVERTNEFLVKMIDQLRRERDELADRVNNQEAVIMAFVGARNAMEQALYRAAEL